MHGHFVVFERKMLICIFLQGSILNAIEKRTATNSLIIREACSYCCFNSIVTNLRVLIWECMCIYICICVCICVHVYIYTRTQICNCTIYWNLHLSLSTSKFIFISISVSLFLSIYCRYLSKNEILLLIRFLFFFAEEHVIGIF